MKNRLLLGLVGLAITLVVSARAQEQNTLDPEVRQQIEALIEEHAHAVNKNDTPAIAALYTQDAVQIRSWESDGGTVSGQQAIEKRFAVELASSPGEYVDKLVQVYPVGDEISAVSQWSWGIGKGYYARIYIRDADNWKIRVEYAVLSMIPR
jgi:ketosteroid isomerase-like protein